MKAQPEYRVGLFRGDSWRFLENLTPFSPMAIFHLACRRHLQARGNLLGDGYVIGTDSTVFGMNPLLMHLFEKSPVDVACLDHF